MGAVSHAACWVCWVRTARCALPQRAVIEILCCPFEAEPVRCTGLSFAHMVCRSEAGLLPSPCLCLPQPSTSAAPRGQRAAARWWPVLCAKLPSVPLAVSCRLEPSSGGHAFCCGSFFRRHRHGKVRRAMMDRLGVVAESVDKGSCAQCALRERTVG